MTGTGHVSNLPNPEPLVRRALSLYAAARKPYTYPRHRPPRRPHLCMASTIPARLARPAATSANPQEARKRAIQLYRDWYRGVRLLPLLRPPPHPHR